MEHAHLIEEIIKRIFIPIEASGRHVHVTSQQAMQLFGHELTPKRPLSQPGQYLAEERVCLVGPKGRLDHVAVLGPARKEAQVEISLTDGKILGISPPLRLSGNSQGTPGLTLIGSQGQVELSKGVMAAQRHIHLSPQDATRFQVQDQQVVQLQVFTSRPVIFEDVVVRVSPEFQAAVHLDYDEANACGFRQGDVGRILT